MRRSTGATAGSHEIVTLVGKVVGKANVGDDDVAVAVQKQIFELEIAMDDVLLMKVRDTGDELSKETAGMLLLEILVRENVVEELASRGILEDDTDVAIRLDDFVETDNVG